MDIAAGGWIVPRGCKSGHAVVTPSGARASCKGVHPSVKCKWDRRVFYFDKGAAGTVGGDVKFWKGGRRAGDWCQVLPRCGVTGVRWEITKRRGCAIRT